MSSSAKKQKLAAGSVAAAVSAPPPPPPARPPALSDATLRAALRPGQFVVVGQQSAESGETEYTLHRFVSVSASGAQLVEYEPDGSGQSATPQQTVRCDWSEQLCLPVRPSLVSGATVYALYIDAVGALTTVYYRGVLQPLGKGKTTKSKDRQVEFAEGQVQTLPVTATFDGVQLPAIMTPVPLTAQLVQPLLATAPASAPSPRIQLTAAQSASTDRSPVAQPTLSAASPPSPRALSQSPRAQPFSAPPLAHSSSGGSLHASSSVASASAAASAGSSTKRVAASHTAPSPPAAATPSSAQQSQFASPLSASLDVHIPLLSPSALLFATDALSPAGGAAPNSAQQQAAASSRRKRTFHIHTPRTQHSLHADEPALQPVDARDRAGDAQQQRSASEERQWRMGRYVSALGCVHEWSEIRMLQSRQLVVAPYVLMSS